MHNIHPVYGIMGYTASLILYYINTVTINGLSGIAGMLCSVVTGAFFILKISYMVADRKKNKNSKTTDDE